MIAADFLVKIGVFFNKVSFIWTKPDEHYDIIAMEPKVIRIQKLDKVDLAIDKKTKKPELVEGSQVEISLDSS